MRDGFVKVAAGTPSIRVADPAATTTAEQIFAFSRCPRRDKNPAIIILLQRDRRHLGRLFWYLGGALRPWPG